MTPRCCLPVLWLSVALAMPGTAGAGSGATPGGGSGGDDRARAFFQAGAQAYDAGRFDAAAEAFEEAYKQAPLPAILFSMAQAERKQYFVSRQREYLDRALAHYRAYLDAKGSTRRAEAADALAQLEAVAARVSPAPAAKPEPPKPVKARLMVTTQAAKATVAIDGQAPVEAPFIGELSPGRHRVRVSAEGYYPEEREVEVVLGSPVGLDLPLRERAGLLTVEAPSGTEVLVDGAAVGDLPLARPVELASGPHALTLVRRGLQPWSREVVLERGKTTTVKATMESTTQRIVSFGVLGLGAVALAGGGACTAVAFNRQGAAQAVLDEQTAGNLEAGRLSDYGRAVRQRNQWRTAATASFGAGAGLLTVGVLLYLLDRPVVTPAVAPKAESGPTRGRPSLPAEVGAAPMALPGGAGVSLAGRF